MATPSAASSVHTDSKSPVPAAAVASSLASPQESQPSASVITPAVLKMTTSPAALSVPTDGKSSVPAVAVASSLASPQESQPSASVIMPAVLKMTTSPASLSVPTDSKSSVPAVAVTSSLASAQESQPSAAATPSVKLPPMSSRTPSVTLSEPHSILTTTSVAQTSLLPELAAPAAEEPPPAEQAPQATKSPFAAGSPHAVLDTLTAPPRRRRQKSAWHTHAVLIVSALLAGLVATSAFAVALLDRLELYRLGGLYDVNREEDLPHDWLEVAICFGPRLPAGVLRHNSTGVAPPRVDDATSYHRLFGDGGFDWRKSPLELLASPAAAVARHLDWLQVNTSERDQPKLRHTDMPLLFQYSLCRNFSGFHWSEAPNRSQSWLNLTMPLEKRNQLLDGVAASFVDVFAYRRGMFSEFYTVSKQVAFRTDLRRPLRLRLEVIMRRHLNGAHKKCEPGDGYEPVPCLSWCRTRALLSQANCTMPWMDALMFDMSDIRISELAKPTQRKSELLSPEKALPWMAEFAQTRRPCESSAEFNALFRLVDKLMLFETAAPGVEALRCRDTCPPHCDEMTTRLRPVGDMLVVQDGVSLLQLEVPHQLQIFCKEEKMLLETPALLLELAGLLAFLFGASVLGVHDWCFMSLCQLLIGVGLLERRRHTRHRRP